LLRPNSKPSTWLRAAFTSPTASMRTRVTPVRPTPLKKLVRAQRATPPTAFT
jgi:hypothetical protein